MPSLRVETFIGCNDAYASAGCSSRHNSMMPTMIGVGMGVLVRMRVSVFDMLVLCVLILVTVKEAHQASALLLARLLIAGRVTVVSFAVLGEIRSSRCSHCAGRSDGGNVARVVIMS